MSCEKRSPPKRPPPKRLSFEEISVRKPSRKPPRRPSNKLEIIRNLAIDEISAFVLLDLIVTTFNLDYDLLSVLRKHLDLCFYCSQKRNLLLEIKEYIKKSNDTYKNMFTRNYLYYDPSKIMPIRYSLMGGVTPSRLNEGLRPPSEYPITLGMIDNDMCNNYYINGESISPSPVSFEEFETLPIPERYGFDCLSRRYYLKDFKRKKLLHSWMLSSVGKLYNDTKTASFIRFEINKES